MAINPNKVQQDQTAVPCKPTACFNENTGILMDNGSWQWINKLNIGDPIIEADGHFAYVISRYYEVLRGFKLTPEAHYGDPYIVNAEHLLPLIHIKSREKKLVSVWDWYNMTKKEQDGWRMYKRGIAHFRGEKDSFRIDPYKMGYKYYGKELPDTPGLSFTTLPSLHPYSRSTIKCRLEFLAGLMDAKGIRVLSGYKFDTCYDTLAKAVLATCWSLGMEATNTFYVMGKLATGKDVGIHHIKIKERGFRIPSRKYQTTPIEDPDSLTDTIEQDHSLCKFQIEDTGSYTEFYGICTDGSGYCLTQDFMCVYHCELLPDVVEWM